MATTMRIKLGILGALLLCSIGAMAVFYQLEEVRREDTDLYTARAGAVRVIIETRYCHEFPVGEEAVLEYNGVVDSGNKILFSNGEVCQVVKVWKRGDVR